MAKFTKEEEQPDFAESEVVAPHLTGDTTVANPDREKLASRAYELYLERGGADGMDMDDWLEAERELMQRGQRPPGSEREP